MTSGGAVDYGGEKAVYRKNASKWLPLIIYVVVAAVTLGMGAATSSANMIADQPNRDIWQHIAAIRALMDNLADPQNPFVVSAEPSRHFHVLWVTTAAVASAFGLSVWQAVTGATFLIMSALALAIYVFARVFFVSRWAPTLLLTILLFAWLYPYEHTGFHSFWTLLYGAAYPATLMTALSLLLWATVIKALEKPWLLLFVFVLSAVMVATHALGAIIGYVGAFAFAVATPDAPLRNRLYSLATGIAGFVVALAWPYFNVIELTLRGGNSSWEGGPNFYASPWMPEVLIPAVLGLVWLRHKKARPLALALGLFLCAYSLGFLGVQVASRFLAPIVLILQIALAGQILDWMAWRRIKSASIKNSVALLAAAAVVVWAIDQRAVFQSQFSAIYATGPDVYAAASEITKDLPNNEPVAAAGNAAWPIVATGQRVLSVPWPEPGIADLADRQSSNETLFREDISAQARIVLAKELGVKVLIVDQRLAAPALLKSLEETAHATSQAGVLRRFDFWQ